MALDFDGTNDKVEHGDIAAIDGAAALTVAAWVNRDTSAGGDVRQNFCDKDGGGNSGLWSVFDFTSQGTLLVSPTGSGTSFGHTAAGTFTATAVWVHVAFVFNGAGALNADRLKIFKDAVEVTPLTFSGTVPAALASNAQQFAFARNALGGFFNGKMALPRIWVAALTAEELKRERASYLPVRRSGLILDAPYDDGTKARDYSGKGNHGTVTEAVQFTGPPVAYGPRVLRPRGFRSQLRRQPPTLTPPRAWYGL